MANGPFFRSANPLLRILLVLLLFPANKHLGLLMHRILLLLVRRIRIIPLHYATFHVLFLCEKAQKITEMHQIFTHKFFFLIQEIHYFRRDNRIIRFGFVVTLINPFFLENFPPIFPYI